VHPLPGILEPGRAHHHVVGGLDLGRHLGQPEQDRLVLRDRLAEGLALLGVADAELEGAQGDAARPGGDVDPPDLDTVHHLKKPLPGSPPRIWSAEIWWSSRIISVVSIPL